MNTTTPVPLKSLASLTVLVVEDEEMIRDALMHNLTRFGIQHFWVVGTVAEGRAIISHAMVNMVISDCDVNGENGKVFLDKVADTQPCAYRLLISGNPDNFQGVTLHKCLGKPFGSNDIKAHLEEALDQMLWQEQR